MLLSYESSVDFGSSPVVALAKSKIFKTHISTLDESIKSAPSGCSISKVFDAIKRKVSAKASTET